MTDVLSIALSVVGLLLAIWAITLALKTDAQISNIEGLTSDAAETLASAQLLLSGMRNDLADLDNRQGSKLDELAASIADIRDLSDNLTSEKGQTKDEREDVDAAEYAGLRLIGLEELPFDIRAAAEKAAGARATWALQRRGRGRARWLVGTPARGPWRVTRRSDGHRVEEVPALADAVEPTTLDDLGTEARDALAAATGLHQAELDETVYRRRSRGVPVFYTIQDRGEGTQTWRLVKTRWGWSAVLDD